MKKLQLTIILLGLFQASASAQSLPDDAQELLKKQQVAIARLDETLNRELEKVKLRCMKDGDLEGANAVDSVIKDPEKLPADAASDPLVGTVWHFLGSGRDKINEVEFLKGGKVRCEVAYKNATWRRIDKTNILFGYGDGDSYIVFRATDAEGKNMTGYLYIGKPRHLQRVK